MTATMLASSGGIQVVDYRCRARRHDPPFAELHRSFTIAYVRRGSFGCRTRGEAFELVRGSFLLGRPGDEYACCSQDAQSAGFGPRDAPALWLSLDPAARPSATHVAFRAPDRQAVDRFFGAGLDAGGKDNGKPGVRADYAPTYYAAFLLDPDGNNVEAVCMK